MLRMFNKGASWLWGTFAVLFVLILFTKGVLAFVDHDEHQFIAASVLFLREGLLPFRDYTYIHTPYLSLILLLPFSLSDALLFSGRLLSIMSMGALILLWMWYAVSKIESNFMLKLAIMLSPILLISTEAFTYTSSRVWEHPPALLFFSIAFLMLLRSQEKGRFFWAIQGFLAAFACLIRLGYAPMGILMFAVVLIQLRSQLDKLLFWMLGAGLACIPMLMLTLISPNDVYFGLWTFHTQIDPAYLAQSLAHQEHDQGISSLLKLSMTKDLVPLYLFSSLTLIAFLYRGIVRRRWQRESALSLLFFTVSVWVSIAKGVVFLQYLALPLLLLWIFSIQVLLKIEPHILNYFGHILLIFSLSAAALNHSIYWRMHLLFQPAKWTALNVHHQSIALLNHADKDSAVLTLSPLFVLEAKRSIYPELANGPFLWRTAEFATDEQKSTHKLIGEEDLQRFIKQKQASAFLLGHEERLEKSLLTYCKEKSVQSGTEMGLTLFLNPRY